MSFCHRSTKEDILKSIHACLLHTVIAYSDMGLSVFKNDKNLVQCRINSLNSSSSESIQ